MALTLALTLTRTLTRTLTLALALTLTLTLTLAQVDYLALPQPRSSHPEVRSKCSKYSK